MVFANSDPKKLVNLDHRSGWHRKTTSETIAGTKNHTTSKSTRSFEDFEGDCQPIIYIYNAFQSVGTCWMSRWRETPCQVSKGETW